MDRNGYDFSCFIILSVVQPLVHRPSLSPNVSDAGPCFEVSRLTSSSLNMDWWKGKATGKQGAFHEIPSDYVKIALDKGHL